MPELDGCHTQGDTLDEVIGNIKEAAEVYLDNLDADDRRELLSTQVLLTAVEVEMRDLR